MSGKTNKQSRRQMRKAFNEYYRETADLMAARNTKLLKTKPKWVPMWLWIQGVKIFVNVK